MRERKKRAENGQKFLTSFLSGMHANFSKHLIDILPYVFTKCILLGPDCTISAAQMIRCLFSVQKMFMIARAMQDEISILLLLNVTIELIRSFFLSFKFFFSFRMNYENNGSYIMSFGTELTDSFCFKCWCWDPSRRTEEIIMIFSSSSSNQNTLSNSFSPRVCNVCVSMVFWQAQCIIRFMFVLLSRLSMYIFNSARGQYELPTISFVRNRKGQFHGNNYCCCLSLLFGVV